MPVSNCNSISEQNEKTGKKIHKMLAKLTSCTCLNKPSLLLINLSTTNLFFALSKTE